MTPGPARIGRSLLLVVVTVLGFAAAAFAEDAGDFGTGSSPALLADIVVPTPEAVREVIERLDEIAGGTVDFPSHGPVVMVLHGDEALAFTRARYPIYKDAVDRAARLQAFGLLDVRVCETWMRARGIDRADLPPFVGTVPDGVAEQRRLEREGYVRF